MILIIAALKAELLPLIKHYNITQKQNVENGALYAGGNIHLLRTGIGIQSAGKVLTTYLKSYKPDKIMDIGAAGALTDKLDKGSIRQVTSILNKANQKLVIKPLLPDRQAYENAVLFTSSKPVLDGALREQLSMKYRAEMVDMEAFTLAEISAKANIPFHCIKIISDHADHDTVHDFQTNIGILSDTLCGLIIEFLDNAI
ncbi:MAG: hypothetical protein P8X42_04590 [Calditrichaceae bacterium]